jgi:hypothetical protein
MGLRKHTLGLYPCTFPCRWNFGLAKVNASSFQVRPPPSVPQCHYVASKLIRRSGQMHQARRLGRISRLGYDFILPRWQPEPESLDIPIPQNHVRSTGKQGLQYAPRPMPGTVAYRCRVYERAVSQIHLTTGHMAKGQALRKC